MPLEGVLYDQFGLPYETRYSLAGIGWFRSADIEYRGTWPPVEWSQFGNALRFRPSSGSGAPAFTPC